MLSTSFNATAKRNKRPRHTQREKDFCSFCVINNFHTVPVQESVKRESYCSSSIVGLFICFKTIRGWMFKTDARISTDNFDFHRQTLLMLRYVTLNINQSLIPTTKTKKEGMKVHCLKENVLLLHILTSDLLSPVCLLIDLFCLLSQLFLL